MPNYPLPPADWVIQDLGVEGALPADVFFELLGLAAQDRNRFLMFCQSDDWNDEEDQAMSLLYLAIMRYLRSKWDTLDTPIAYMEQVVSDFLYVQIRGEKFGSEIAGMHAAEEELTDEIAKHELISAYRKKLDDELEYVESRLSAIFSVN
jgi:hemoglobin-like flavoprotein